MQTTSAPDGYFASLGPARYMMLTTFKPNGTPVSAPMQVMADGDRVSRVWPPGCFAGRGDGRCCTTNSWFRRPRATGRAGNPRAVAGSGRSGSACRPRRTGCTARAPGPAGPGPLPGPAGPEALSGAARDRESGRGRMARSWRRSPCSPARGRSRRGGPGMAPSAWPCTAPEQRLHILAPVPGPAGLVADLGQPPAPRPGRHRCRGHPEQGRHLPAGHQVLTHVVASHRCGGGFPGSFLGGFPGSFPGGLPGSFLGGFPGSFPGGFPGSFPGGLPAAGCGTSAARPGRCRRHHVHRIPLVGQNERIRDSAGHPPQLRPGQGPGRAWARPGRMSHCPMPVA
jgi:hypothetical protein